MRPVTVSAPASTGFSAPVVLDYMISPSDFLLAVEFGTAVATCTVEYSPDDPYATYATNYNTDGHWYAHPVLAGISADGVDSLNVPVRAVRLHNTAWTSGQPALVIVTAGVR